ncbi:flavodoxin [Dehalobacterium formicoaceticum]|uniref:flavodoxin n=1 Tax=Dehalobacterium formicoaceticum TaxID=51515 RepID=UPI000B7E0DFE|nr:flavodoxin [Dehalobacterium formicoaceticum]
MKKITTIFMSLMLIFSLTACGNSKQAENTTPMPSSEQERETTSALAGSEKTKGTNGKTLVVYFSATGNTEEVANYIAAATGAELFEIEPVEPYSKEDLDWRNEDSRVFYEHDHPDARDVELVTTTVPDWASYDTVYLGYPIWWGNAAWPVDGFIEGTDFTGKTVVPFCTSSSSGLGESDELLKKLAGTGNWLAGERFQLNSSEETVKAWIEDLGL